METRIDVRTDDELYRAGLRDYVAGRRDTPEAQFYVQSCIEQDAIYRSRDHLPETVMQQTVQVATVEETL